MRDVSNRYRLHFPSVPCARQGHWASDEQATPLGARIENTHVEGGVRSRRHAECRTPAIQERRQVDRQVQTREREDILPRNVLPATIGNVSRGQRNYALARDSNKRRYSCRNLEFQDRRQDASASRRPSSPQAAPGTRRRMAAAMTMNHAPARRANTSATVVGYDHRRATTLAGQFYDDHPGRRASTTSVFRAERRCATTLPGSRNTRSTPRGLPPIPPARGAPSSASFPSGPSRAWLALRAAGSLKG